MTSPLLLSLTNPDRPKGASRPSSSRTGERQRESTGASRKASDVDQWCSAGSGRRIMAVSVLGRIPSRTQALYAWGPEESNREWPTARLRARCLVRGKTRTRSRVQVPSAHGAQPLTAHHPGHLESPGEVGDEGCGPALSGTALIVAGCSHNGHCVGVRPASWRVLLLSAFPMLRGGRPG
jgi:hypothetical protein